MRRVTALILSVLAAVLVGSVANAQTCDYMILSAFWKSHSADSIDIGCRPNVVGPVSSDPQNPTVYDALIRIRVNGAIVNDQMWQLRWHHGVTCPVSCPSTAVCEEKEWSNNKGDVVRDRSYCARDAQNNCICPRLGGAPVAHKTIRKPTGSATIDVEIIPLNLQGCSPINPGNNVFSFPYPGPGGGGGGVPGLAPQGAALLLAALGLTAMLALRRRATES